MIIQSPEEYSEQCDFYLWICMKKWPAGLSISFRMESGSRFLPFDGVHGADIVAGAAIDAGLFVDHVDGVSVADSIDRADRFTCATTRTIINNVVRTHDGPP